MNSDAVMAQWYWSFGFCYYYIHSFIKRKYVFNTVVYYIIFYFISEIFGYRREEISQRLLAGSRYLVRLCGLVVVTRRVGSPRDKPESTLSPCTHNSHIFHITVGSPLPVTLLACVVHIPLYSINFLYQI